MQCPTTVSLTANTMSDYADVILKRTFSVLCSFSCMLTVCKVTKHKIHTRVFGTLKHVNIF